MSEKAGNVEKEADIKNCGAANYKDSVIGRRAEYPDLGILNLRVRRGNDIEPQSLNLQVPGRTLSEEKGTGPVLGLG